MSDKPMGVSGDVGADQPAGFDSHAPTNLAALLDDEEMVIYGSAKIVKALYEAGTIITDGFARIAMETALQAVKRRVGV